MNVHSLASIRVLLALTATAAILSLACSGGALVNPDMDGVAASLLVPRPAYDTSRSFGDLVKPHFFATTADGEQREIQGDPELILEMDGRVKVRLNFNGQELFVDLLALEPELLGDHPVHKVWRLREMGIPVDDALDKQLRLKGFDQGVFGSVTFQYLPDQEVSGVISEIFPDGTFLVIPFDTPPEWRGSQPEIASPTHLHVNPRALSVGDSPLAAAYEQEILSLPFDDQRYPPPLLAKKQCDVYHESLLADEYVDILSDAGYRFTADHVAGNASDAEMPFGERLSSLLREGSGEGSSYFGFERFWVADRLAALAVPWMEECDSAGSPRRYRRTDASSDKYYIVVRRSLEPEKTQRYKILLLADDGSAREIYTAPGIVLMAQPLPDDDNRWLLSTEGWQAPEGDSPPDPRWQSVYLVDMRYPEEYSKVQYPISQFPKAPDAGLYGVSPVLSADGRFLMNTLYGFKDEGGGIWISDLSAEDYHTKPEQFSRVVSWDHTLSWTKLERDTEDSPPYYHLFMTGKEVADDFAMTANILRVRDAGLDTSIVYQERLLQMVGWNPVPFAMQRLSDQKFRIAVETHFNYESSLLPRAKGVYIVPVDLSEINYGIVP